MATPDPKTPTVSNNPREAFRTPESRSAVGGGSDAVGFPSIHNRPLRSAGISEQVQEYLRNEVLHEILPQPRPPARHPAGDRMVAQTELSGGSVSAKARPHARSQISEGTHNDTWSQIPRQAWRPPGAEEKKGPPIQQTGEETMRGRGEYRAKSVNAPVRQPWVSAGTCLS